MLDGAGSAPERSLDTEKNTIGIYFGVPFIYGDSSLIKYGESVREKSQESFIFVTLFDADSCHVIGENIAGECVLGSGHFRDVIRSGSWSEPVNEVLVCVALQVDDVATFSKKFAMLTRVCYLG